MKNQVAFFLLAILFLCTGGGFRLQAQSWDWARSAGGVYYPEEGRAMAVDQQGNVYITGTHRKFAFFDMYPMTSAGGGDVFIAKYNSAGVFQWVQRMGGSGTDKGNALSIDGQGNVFLAAQANLYLSPGGSAHSGHSGANGSRHLLDGIIAKYGANANMQWIRIIDGTVYTLSTDIAADPSGYSYAVGIYDGLVYLDQDTLQTKGQDDVYLVRLDPQGQMIWGTGMGGTGNEDNAHVAVTPNGDVVVAGVFEGTAFFDGDTLVSAGGKDIFLVKYSQTGVHLWSKSYPGAGNQTLKGLEVDSQGNIVIAGYFLNNVTFGNQVLTSAGLEDIWVARLDPAGNPVDAKSWGSAASESLGEMSFARDSRIVLSGTVDGTFTAGNFTLQATGANDAFFIGLDTAWNVLWAEVTGINDAEIGLGATMDQFGNGYTTGQFTSKAAFGADTVISKGFEDIFFAKYCTATELNLTSVTPQIFCPGAPFTAQLEVWGCLDNPNSYYLELSDSSGAFGLPWMLDTITSPTGGTFSGNLPANLPEGQHYRMRIRSKSPVFLGADNGVDLVVSRPAVQIQGDTLICPAGDSVQLDAGAGFASYVWNTGAASQTIWASLAGVYEVTVTDGQGCSNSSQVTVSVCLDREELQAGSWEVFPNPAGDWVEVRFAEPFAGKIQLTNSLGIILREIQVQREEEIRLNISDLSAGNYFMVIQKPDFPEIRKLIKY
ncbi:MAG: T9SS type A sorting domain-containing protein [Bacteroidia bacterium]|nr:T9SS type A sorting domain-containing protein [Bacteroidia bacterium]